MIIYKTKYFKIVIEKNNGFYDVVKKTKNVFGKGYVEEVLTSNLTKEKALAIKEQLKNI